MDGGLPSPLFVDLLGPGQLGQELWPDGWEWVVGGLPFTGNPGQLVGPGSTGLSGGLPFCHQSLPTGELE